MDHQIAGLGLITQLVNACDNADMAILLYQQFRVSTGATMTIAEFLMLLARGSFFLYGVSENPSYIEKAVAFITVAKTAASSTDRASPTASPQAIYSVEGQAFHHRFRRFGEIDDIERAISSLKQALECANGDTDDVKADILGNLGKSLKARFNRSGNITDIDEAILRHEEAIALTPGGHSDRPTWLSNLGNSLRARFERLGDMADINRAVLVHQQAVDLTPDGHIDKPSWLSNLAYSLLRRFERLGDTTDIGAAILRYQQAFDTMPDERIEKASISTMLGLSLLRRFERLGNLADVDNAVLAQERAIIMMPDGHADKPTLLTNLGSSLQARFERLGNIADITNAIMWQQQAVNMTPSGHASKPAWLNNLGTSLQTRFERLGDIADVNSAIIIKQQGIDLTPDGHAQKPFWLSNLGNSLEARFKRLGDITDINNGILRQQQAVDLMPDGHASKPSLLNNLGNALRARFERLEDPIDIDNAILMYQQAVDLTPDGHASRLSLLCNLGNSLHLRYKRHQQLEDIPRSISSFRAAALSPFGLPSRRLDAARRWAKLHFLLLTFPDSDDLDVFNLALEGYRTVISLIPQVVWLGRTIEQRYKDLETLGDVVMEAVSVACTAGEYDLALEWFEQGRAIIWGQILRLRSPMDDLQASHPDLANELKIIAKALEAAGSGDPEPSKDVSPLEQTAEEHRRLAAKWESVLTSVRALPGFSDFLQPKPASALRKAATSGTIVVVNVGVVRSDALILQPGSSSIGHLHLSTLSLKKIDEARNKFIKCLRANGLRVRDTERGSPQVPPKSRNAVPEVLRMRWEKITGPILGRFGNATQKSVVQTNPDKDLERGSIQTKTKPQDPVPNVLEMLWDDIAKPILGYLGYTTPPSPGNLPHITWCLTGSLAILPLHAAGAYSSSRSKDKLFNYVISSYTPSLTSLIERVKQTPTNISARNILAITQKDTPNLSPLPGTIREVDQIQTQWKNHNVPVTRMDGDQATVEKVLEAMNTHSWIHLACHGQQNALEPTKSAFFLHDGALELATIMKTRLKNAELAYLSACQTASGDTKLPDEAVHLAAGMFIAGYPSVVATLWAINDNDAPLVAQKFYECLLNNPERGVARALHEAVAVLRAKVGEDKFFSWIPYIHVGH